MSEIKEQQPAYISRVHLKGYKSIRDLEIDFKAGLNIIIGPNGSGKTNFLEFIYESQNNQTYPALMKEDFYFEIWANLERRTTAEGKLMLEKNGIYYEVREKGFTNNELIQERLIRTNVNTNETKIGFIKDDSENPQSMYGGASMKVFFRGVNFIRFSSKYDIGNGLSFGILKDYSGENVATINSEVANPYELFILIQTSLINIDFKNINHSEVREKFFVSNNDLIKNLQNFTPIKNLSIDNESIIIQYIDNRLKVSNVNFKFLVNNKWLFWNQLSDGTKRMFYIISQLTANLDIFYFIEEPELGIHPDQLYLLMDFLKEQSKEKQIIITTHSPEVLNILEKDELDRIIITRFDGDKGTQMHHLSPKKIRKGVNYMSKEGLTLKDFWVHSNLEEYDEEEYEVR